MAEGHPQLPLSMGRGCTSWEPKPLSGPGGHGRSVLAGAPGWRSDHLHSPLDNPRGGVRNVGSCLVTLPPKIITFQAHGACQLLGQGPWPPFSAIRPGAWPRAWARDGPQEAFDESTPEQLLAPCLQHPGLLLEEGQGPLLLRVAPAAPQATSAASYCLQVTSWGGLQDTHLLQCVASPSLFPAQHLPKM